MGNRLTFATASIRQCDELNDFAPCALHLISMKAFDSNSHAVATRAPESIRNAYDKAEAQ